MSLRKGVAVALGITAVGAGVIAMSVHGIRNAYAQQQVNTVRLAVDAPQFPLANVTQQNGPGTPLAMGLSCAASVNNNTLYFDRSATGQGHRLWLCHADGTGANWAWENFAAVISDTVTPAITNTFALVGSTYTGTVAEPKAAVGMTAYMLPIGDPGGVMLREAWVSTAGTINYKLTNLTVANTTITSVKFALYLQQP